MRTEFLKLRQGRSTLHEYIQQTRFLASCVISSPIDMATQVTTFMSGLRDGPVKQHVFRAYPETLEDAFAIAQREEFSAKLGHSVGYHPSMRERGPEPMDLSVARADSGHAFRPNNRRRVPGKCYRCHKLGHFAANCRAPAPISASANAAYASDVVDSKNDDLQ